MLSFAPTNAAISRDARWSTTRTWVKAGFNNTSVALVKAPMEGPAAPGAVAVVTDGSVARGAMVRIIESAVSNTTLDLADELYVRCDEATADT